MDNECLERIERKIDGCADKVSNVDAKVEAFIAEGAVRLRTVERLATEHEQLLKGKRRQAGLVDDVRELQTTDANRKRLHWAAVVAFLGLLIKQTWGSVAELFHR